MDNNIYDLIDIIVADQSVSARPVSFIYDKSGLPVEPSKYQTTCPKCSQLIEFTPQDILTDAEDKYVQGCDDCPIPANLKPQPPTTYNSIKLPDPTEVIREDLLASSAVLITKQEKQTKQEHFIDPIESGRLIIKGVHRKDA